MLLLLLNKNNNSIANSCNNNNNSIANSCNNNNNRIATCIFYLAKKKVINLKMAPS